MLSDFDLDEVPEATVTTETRGDMTFQVITVPIDDVTSDEGLGGDLGEGLTEDFQISFTEDRVTVRGNTTLDDALGAGGGEEMGLTPEMMAQFFEINVRVTMPGKVLDHNADSQSGNTLTWNVDLTGGSLDIFAESDPNASSSSSTMLYVLIGAAAVLVALVLWYFMRRKSGGGGGAAPAAPMAPAADTPPPAPPPSE
jgi:LPXTG-motif cell wall-anchored protein